MSIQYYSLDSVPSTNDFTKELFSLNLVQDTVMVTAKKQTKGKGSKGRSWYSESNGGLYMSVGLVPKTFSFDKVKATHLLVAEHMSELIQAEYQLTIDISPPNDLMIGGKKCGGILIETQSMMGRKKPFSLIIGMGLNINQTDFPDELKNIATSFKLETGKTYDKEQLITPIVEQLNKLF